MSRQTASQAISAAVAAVDAAWAELRDSAYASFSTRTPRMPEITPEEAQRRSALGAKLLADIAAIDERALPHELALDIRVARACAQRWSREADWYWLVFDPMGLGFFALFMPTAYAGGFLLNALHGAAQSWRFDRVSDGDRYAAFVADYARLIAQMAARTQGQADRGILMPKAQLAQARGLVEAMSAQAAQALLPETARLQALGDNAPGFVVEMQRRVDTMIKPAFAELRGVLGAEYEAKAPDTVGIGQYPRGAEIYAELVRLHTTVDLTPDQVHARGLERMAAIQAQKQAIRAEAGFADDAAGYEARVAQDPRWLADSADGVKAIFQRYIDRLKPHYDDFFNWRLKADYTAEPLPAALEPAMTFGYYDAPNETRAYGRYLFNAGNLTRKPLHTIAALNYHELVPGHHQHLTTQRESQTLHPLRKHAGFNAFNEGWAEYAATLAGEVGMYAEPEEFYGRLTMDAFLTCRLVVDTGMNVMGWSLEQARDYMRENAGMSEAEIKSESIRYSCDIPGQSLAYKLGDTEILAMRERMREKLGNRFDLRDFHASILSVGGLPLPDLHWHIDQVIEERLAA